MISSVRRSQIFEKKYRRPNLGPTGLNQAQNEVLHNFLEFGSLVFLEIAYNDSLQHIVEVKTHEKKCLGPKFGPNEPKSVPELVFFVVAIFASFVP